MISRRQFGALSAGLLLPRRLLAAADGEQQLLFIFCAGGWDQTAVFAPLFYLLMARADTVFVMIAEDANPQYHFQANKEDNQRASQCKRGYFQTKKAKYGIAEK